MIKEADFYLHTLIARQADGVDGLPTPLTVEAWKEGQKATPLYFIEFFEVMYSGANKPSENDNFKELAKSASHVHSKQRQYKAI